MQAMWNKDVEAIRQNNVPGVLWIDRSMDGYGRFPSNATPSGYIRLATVQEYKARMEESIASSEALQQWIKESDTVLVLARINNGIIVDYSFHANVKVGRFLLHPISNP